MNVFQAGQKSLGFEDVYERYGEECVPHNNNNNNNNNKHLNAFSFSEIDLRTVHVASYRGNEVVAFFKNTRGTVDVQGNVMTAQTYRTGWQYHHKQKFGGVSWKAVASANGPVEGRLYRSTKSVAAAAMGLDELSFIAHPDPDPERGFATTISKIEYARDRLVAAKAGTFPIRRE